MKNNAKRITLLLILLFFCSILNAYQDNEKSESLLDKRTFSLGVIGAMHLKTTYINPLGDKYTAEADADQQKYFGLSGRWFIHSNFGVGANFLLLDAVDNMYEFGTLFLWDFNLLLRVELFEGIVFNAAGGITQLMLFIRDKAKQEHSLQWGDVSYNIKLGLEVFLFKSCFSVTIDWKIQQYKDHNNYKTEMQSLVFGAHLWF